MLYYFKINENVEHFMQVTYPPITVCYRQSNNLINTYTNLKVFSRDGLRRRQIIMIMEKQKLKLNMLKLKVELYLNELGWKLCNNSRLKETCNRFAYVLFIFFFVVVDVLFLFFMIHICSFTHILFNVQSQISKTFVTIC